jgi:Flp pilus assembly protein TadD
MNKYHDSIKAIISLSFCALLGACASPGYAPIIEEQSTKAIPSQRITAHQTSSTATIPQPSKPSAVSPVEEPVVEEATVYIAPAPAVVESITPDQSVSSAQPPQIKQDQAVKEAPRILPESEQVSVVKLLANADQLKAQGKVTEAVIQLQRAQRIAPREPKVYARLSALQLSLGEAAKAEQLALKGLTLVSAQKDYQYYFWKLIGASRSYLGNFEGEQRAILEAAKYK